MGEKKTLSAKEKRFVREYLICGNAREAAECAGYPPESAETQGERLLSSRVVQEYRRELEQSMLDRIGISRAWIARRLVEIVDRCMQSTPHMARNPETKQREPDGTWEFDPTGAMRALHELDAHLSTIAEENDHGNREDFEDWLQKQGESGL